MKSIVKYYIFARTTEPETKALDNIEEPLLIIQVVSNILLEAWLIEGS